MLPSERLLQQQYRACDYQVYSDLIHIILQAKKHDELLAKNGSQRPVGSQPLPKVHMNVANGRNFDGASKGKSSKFNGKRKRKRNKKPRNSDHGKSTAKPKFEKISFVIGVGATRILPTSARPLSIWPFSTSNPKDAKDLKGKGLKPTSTFIRMTPMELVARKKFLRNLATLQPSRSHRTLWVRRT
jgi:hypothetical protein